MVRSRIGRALGEPCLRRVEVNETAIRYVPSYADRGLGRPPHPAEGYVEVVRDRNAPTHQPCPGTIEPQGGGQDRHGNTVRWIGCPSCGWTDRQRPAPPDDTPLFPEAHTSGGEP